MAFRGKGPRRIAPEILQNAGLSEIVPGAESGVFVLSQMSRIATQSDAARG